jgi:predicted ATP-binding protein involved in virulence
MENLSSFKIIAIRLLPDCDNRFSKILDRGCVYQFYDYYDFKLNENRDVVGVKRHDATSQPNLYKPQDDSSTRLISVSAIVGKNGSGKSTLIEILFAVSYMLALSHKILKPNEQSLVTKLKRKDLSDEKHLRNQLDEIRKMRSQLLVELFYEIDGDIFRFLLDGDKNEKVVKCNPDGNGWLTMDSATLNGIVKKFFYSIAVNYSVHGLNSKHYGQWIAKLFHKNDGYRTPLVINPFRREGNIDVNVENHLAQSRLLSNLLGSSNRKNEPLKGYETDRITFSYEKENIELLGPHRLEQVINSLIAANKTDREGLFNMICQTFTGITLDYENAKKSQHFKSLERYLVKKLFKIAQNYPDYKNYYKESVSKEKNSFPTLILNDLLPLLQHDESHITLKIKQVLNTIRYDLLKNDHKSGIVWKDDKLTISIEDLRARIKDIPDIDLNGDLIKYVPAAFYIPELVVKRQGSESIFHFLSSGQLQMIHVIQSIVYHLKNLNSVFHSKKENRLCYENVNIILDEIELYFHPEFQQMFLSELIEAISNCIIPNIKGVNIIFSTHSPFILSDIPRSNILFLQENGIPSSDVQMSTFGGNIHDMLKHSFFLSKGTMGKVSRSWIHSTIHFLNTELSKKYPKKYGELQVKKSIEDELVAHAVDETISKQVIYLIDEPILRRKLSQMYEEAFNANSELEVIRRQIDNLQKQEKEILDKKNNATPS